MTMRLNDLQKLLDEIESGARVPDDGEREYLIVAIYDEKRLEAAYDAALSQAMFDDPTGQDLDAFLGYDS